MKPGMHFEEKWFTTCVTTIWASQLQEPNAGPEKVWFFVQRKLELQNFQVTMRGEEIGKWGLIRPWKGAFVLKAPLISDDIWAVVGKVSCRHTV